MDPKTWAGIAVAAISFFAAIVQRIQRRPALREQLAADVDLWKSLPDDSNSRDALMAHIGDRIKHLIDVDDVKRRDPAGITLGLIMVGGFGWLTYFVWSLGGLFIWLSIPSVILALVGLVGFSTDVKRTVRDEKK